MSYTNDQFYNEVIRRNVARFASTVKVMEILPHLPCLTLSDKEEIQAKRETYGNFSAMQLLLENLRRRDNWPEEFISAVHNCEHWELANEIRADYDRIRGITGQAASNPKSPAVPITTSSGSPPGPAETVSGSDGSPAVPSSTSDGSPAADASSSEGSPAAPVSTSDGSPAAPASSSEGSPAAPVSTSDGSPAAPASSSDGSPATITQATVHTAPVTIPPLLDSSTDEVLAHSGAFPNTPVRDQESQEILDAEPPVVAPSQAPTPPCSMTPTIQQEVLNPSDVKIETSVDLAQPEVATTSACFQASSSSTLQIQNTTPCLSSQSSLVSDMTERLTTVTNTEPLDFEKHPVQDTNPPLIELTPQHPVECSDPTVNQIQTTINFTLPSQADSTQSSSSLPTEAASNGSSSINQEHLSKPGILQHLEPQPQPCSIVSCDLEISTAPEDSSQPGSSGLEDSDSHKTESVADAATSPDEDLESSQKNAPPVTHNQPEENHYEDLNANQEPGTMINVIEINEPAENLNGQPPSLMKHSQVHSEEPLNLNRISAEIVQPEQESIVHVLPKNPQPEEKEAGNPRLIHRDNWPLIAAGGIILSIFLAWKIRH